MVILLKKIVKRLIRILTSYLKLIFVKPIIFFPNQVRENRSKKVLKDYNPELFLATEKIFKQIHQKKLKFRGWSLAKSAIRYALKELFAKKKEKVIIVELGGGVSTFFWFYLQKELKGINFKITTFEHDKEWSDYLNNAIENTIDIVHCRLKQPSDNERINLFRNPNQAIANWQFVGTFLPEEQYKTARVRNVFYDVPLKYLSDNENIDLLIVDGPHGNGRSMCFPLFQNRINKGTVILMDDYNHYPFVDDLKMVFNIEEIVFEDSYSKKWIVLRVV